MAKSNIVIPPGHDRYRCACGFEGTAAQMRGHIGRAKQIGHTECLVSPEIVDVSQEAPESVATLDVSQEAPESVATLEARDDPNEPLGEDPYDQRDNPPRYWRVESVADQEEDAASVARRLREANQPPAGGNGNGYSYGGHDDIGPPVPGAYVEQPPERPIPSKTRVPVELKNESVVWFDWARANGHFPRSGDLSDWVNEVINIFHEVVLGKRLVVVDEEVLEVGDNTPS